MIVAPCPYCGRPPELVWGSAVYPHRPDLHGKRFWRCKPCDAHVGCHPGTTTPLGRLADAALRLGKMQAHDAFDPIWKGKAMSRNDAYAWLASELGISCAECHIGMFDIAMCKRVVEACNQRDRRST